MASLNMTRNTSRKRQPTHSTLIPYFIKEGITYLLIGKESKYISDFLIHPTYHQKKPNYFMI
jgi:hypothetical protein